MYIPRFRRINDVLREMKNRDPRCVLTHRIITQWIATGKITSLKYGNAWLVNIDELYAFLTGITLVASDSIVYEGCEVITGKTKSKKLVTSGEIFSYFQKGDPETIIRRPNLRRFARDNGIEHYIPDGRTWLINQAEFFEKINPKHVCQRYEMPRLRYINGSVIEWNMAHPRKKIDKHFVEHCMKDKSVFSYYHGNRWIINYDQLELVLTAYTKEHVYIPMKTRIKKKIPTRQARKNSE